MRIELQTAQGEPVRDLDIPRITPWPEVVTLGARAFRYYDAMPSRMVYRETFLMALEGYLPGTGMEALRDGRADRA